MLVADLTMNMIEFFDDASDLDRKAPDSSINRLQSRDSGNRCSGGFFRDIQDLEGAGTHPSEHAAAVDLFGQS